METDVHGIFQARREDKWVDVGTKWEQHRHYLLFAWLAGVRNGYGFAGVVMHEPIQPISQPRGLPADWDRGDYPIVASPEVMAPWRRDYLEDDEPPKVWLGDHSYSWLLSSEILAAPRPGKRRCWGVIDIAAYHAWDKVSAPEDYWGGVFGRGALQVEERDLEANPSATHVRVSWISDDDGLDYFVNEVRRLHDLHGEVRLVFGFDS